MRRSIGPVVVGMIGSLALAGVLGGSPRAEQSKSLFDQRCASCHGKDGQAQTPAGKAMHIKPWRGDEHLQKLSDARIREIITEGISEGGKQRMPPNRNLKPEQMNDLLQDVRKLSK